MGWDHIDGPVLCADHGDHPGCAAPGFGLAQLLALRQAHVLPLAADVALVDLDRIGALTLAHPALDAPKRAEARRARNTKTGVIPTRDVARFRRGNTERPFRKPGPVRE